MEYEHEASERKPNVHPMCTSLPAQSVDVKAGSAAHNYLTDRHLSKSLARMNGWFVSTEAGDSFTRIVIPAVVHKAGHIYWQARDVTGKAFIRYQSPKGPRHEAVVRVMHLAGRRGEFVGQHRPGVIEQCLHRLLAQLGRLRRRHRCSHRRQRRSGAERLQRPRDPHRHHPAPCHMSSER